MVIHFVSGLGADERVFQFLDLPGVEKRFIRWVDPIKDETLQQYAGRLIQQIEKGDEIILVGISFGGLIVQEIAAIIPCSKVIIISSIKCDEEFSTSLKFVRFMRLHKIAPASFLKWSNKLTADYFFSVKTKAESALLQRIIEATDDKFMMWAIDQIMRWKKPQPIAGIIHIHGTRDRIFPIGNINGAIKVESGGHFMIVNHAEEISRIILSEINPRY
jgi:pimeloyl-ACP methyl ester carboxylesterase